MRTPWAGRKFGVEMEMTYTRLNGRGIDQQDLINTVNPAIPPSRRSTRAVSYYHSDGSTWDIKTDSSCGWEVASPALLMDENGNNDELMAVCGALTGLAPRITRECGLHVHVDCSDLDWRGMQRLMRLWARYEPFFFSLCPQSRADNGYCSPLRVSRWNGRMDPYGNWLQSGERSCKAREEDTFRRYGARLGRGAFNCAGWFYHGRIEFRLGGGTVNYEKIRRWVMLLLSVVDRAKTKGFGEGFAFSLKDLPTADFETRWMAQVLSLAPSRSLPATELHPEAHALVAWAEGRRLTLSRGTATE